MADSDAVRSRRYRAHRAGDHSFCRHRAPVVEMHPATADASADDLDPVAELRLLAARAVDAYRQDPGNAALAREARATLVVLVGMAPAEEDDELAALLSSPVVSDAWVD